MSVDRDAIAHAWDVPVKEVNCLNCLQSRLFAGGWRICEFWDRQIREDKFCSFYYPKKGDEK